MSEGASKAAHAAASTTGPARLGSEPPGRYEILAEIGAGGMATVQYGRLHAPHGFVRSVAIKRLHAQFAKDPDFVRMFIDEARVSARLSHANIVATLDIIDAPGELALVMEYVHGESLWNLLRLAAKAGQPVPVRIAAALATAVLHGLSAAHEATNERGEALGIVHRDVSPHNILVGSDGIARLIDFGVAKAVGRLRTTPSGEVKGKLLYMAPEQLGASYVDQRADVYGAAAVLWETLTGVSLYDDAQNEPALIHAVLLGRIEAPSRRRPEITPELDGIILQGLARDPAARFETARDMALALERHVGIASQSELAEWLHGLAGPQLAARARLIAQAQAHTSDASTRVTPLPKTTAIISPPEDSSPIPQPGSRMRSRTLRLRRWSLVYAAIGSLLAISFALWLRARPKPSGEGAAVKAQPAQREVSVQAAHAKPEPRAAAEAVDSRSSEPPPSAAAPPAATRPKAAAQAPIEARAVAAPKPEPRRPARPVAVDGSDKPAAARAACKPWFYIDEAGIRRPKPGCL